MIRKPCDRDLPRLMELWQEAFGDSEDETRFYFQYRHRHEHMLVMEIDEQISGMLSLLPIQLIADGAAHQARYVFAVATKKEVRGRGVSTALLTAAHEGIRAEGGVASILVPASENLFTFYGKRGYQAAFFVDQALLSASEIVSSPLRGEVSGLSAEDYLGIRKASFSGSRLFVDWDLDALTYIKLGAESGGGRVLYLRDGAGEAAALIEKRDSIMRVTELALLSGMTWQIAMALIHRVVQAPQYLLRLPQSSLGERNTIPIGMIHWLKAMPEGTGSPAYLALAKD